MTKRRPSGWEDIADILTLEGMKVMKAKMVLTFIQDGQEVNYKVMRVTPYKCWVKKVRLYRPDELDIVDNKASGQ